MDRYFSAYDKVDADSAIVAQAAFDTPVTLEESYPVSDGEELQGKSYVTRSWLLDSPFDAEFNMAFNILTLSRSNLHPCGSKEKSAPV